jgi:AraC family transcriptional regulator of arabinose operon
VKEEIQYFVSPIEREPFTIDMCGISYCDGSYAIERRQSDIFVLEYVEEGTGTIHIGEQIKFNASAGDVYILPRGEDHYYYSDAKFPWKKYFFNVRGEVVDSMLYAYQLYGKHLIHCPSVLPFFLEFQQIAFSKSSREEIFGKCAVLFHQILTELYHVSKNTENLPEDALKLKAYLDENLSRLVSLRELARQISRSPDYTIKLFKKVYHQTPYAYFLHQKMEAAKNMLLNTSFSVQEISNRLGYEDQHYFSNLFKQYCGCAPKYYKK